MQKTCDFGLFFSELWSSRALFPAAGAFFSTCLHFLVFLGCQKHDLETPSTIKITLKGFEWSNLQLKTRKASLILIGLSVTQIDF